MVTFDDIEFKSHASGEGSQGLIFFPNGYGLSVVRFKHPYSSRYSSYTDSKTWEVAILKGTEDNWEICYDTLLTDDVLTYQTEEDINRIIKHIIRLNDNEKN
jgi:hypothetical protein